MAQNPKIESLKKQLSRSKDDTIKVNLLYELAFQYWDYDFEVGLEFSKQCLELAEDLKYPKGIAQGNTSLGLYHYFTGDYQKAESFYETGLKAMNGRVNGDFPAYTLTRIGNLYRVQSQFDSALHYYNLSLEKLPAATGGVALSSVYYNKGLLFILQEKLDSAINSLEESLRMRIEFGDSLLIAESWKAIGLTYIELEQFDKARHYLELLKKVGDSYNDPEIQIFYSIHLGELLMMQGNFLESIEYHKKALDLLSEHDFLRLRILSLYNLGRVFSEMGVYDKAQRYLADADSMNKPLNDLVMEADISYELGYIFTERRIPLAIPVSQKAKRIYQSIGQEKGVAATNNILGISQLYAKKYDSAIYYYNESLAGHRKMNYKKGTAAALYNLSLVFMEQDSLEKALPYQLEALEIEKEINNVLGIIISYNSLGDLYFRMNDLDQSEKYLLMTREQFNPTISLLYMKENAFNLAKLYDAKKDYAKAIQFYQEGEKLSDSLYLSESFKQSIRLSSLYELDLKEDRIRELNRNQEIQEVQLNYQKLQLRQQKNLIVATIIVILFFIVFLYLTIRQNKKLTRAREVLERMNSEIKTKNEEIESQSEQLILANNRISITNQDLEKKVQARTKELTKAHNELDTFFYRASHDFKHPLTTFKGIAELAKKMVKDKESLTLFELVNKNAEAYENMLSKLQSMSTINYEELELKEVSLEDEVNSIVEKFADAISVKKLEVTSNYDIQGSFRTHPEILRIIIERLFENAVDFNKNEGKINLDISIKDEILSICIQNSSGDVIEAANEHRIFDMFYRGSLMSKGNGIGLYIVKKAVEKLNGEVVLLDSSRKFTSFSVTLKSKDPSDT